MGGPKGTSQITTVVKRKYHTPRSKWERGESRKELNAKEMEIEEFKAFEETTDSNR